MKEERNFKKYFFWAVLIIIAIVSYIIIKDFLISILSAFILAYLLRPVDKLLQKWIPKKISAIISLLIVIILLVIPIYFIIQSLISQISSLINLDNLALIKSFLINFQLPNEVQEYLPDALSNISAYGLRLIYSIITQIPSLLLNIILTVLFTYYFILDWDQLVSELKELFPFSNREKTIQNISDTAHTIVYGTFLTAIIEFFIAWIMFSILHIDYALILASLIAIAAFIPIIGPGIVWMPLAVIKIIQGQYLSAVFIIITGIIISYGIDFFLKSLIISRKTKMNPAIFLVGVLGGVALFGVFGFIIGPLVLGFFINIIHSMLEDKTHRIKDKKIQKTNYKRKKRVIRRKKK
jgi:predicted PurR-regulated permease PerM